MSGQKSGPPAKEILFSFSAQGRIGFHRNPTIYQHLPRTGVRSAAGGRNLINVRFVAESDRSAALPQSVGMVESRMGAVAWAMRQRSVSHPRSSNRTCGFPASGSPTGFTVRHTKQSTDRKRHLRGVLSFFASRHSFL